MTTEEYLSLNDKEIYTKICEAIEAHNCVKTAHLTRIMNVPKGQPNKFKQHLYALEALGALRKYGTRQYAWKASKNWRRILGGQKSEPSQTSGGLIAPPKPPTGATGHLDHSLCNAKIEQLRQRINEVQKEKEAEGKAFEELNNKLKEEIERLKKESTETIKTIVIKRADTQTKLTLKDTPVPKCFERVMDLASVRKNVLLVGPAGCGKTFLGNLIAQALKLDFGSISCTSGMTETHLLGRAIPNISTGRAQYQGTEFIRCYEKGGLFLLDELDAADSNILLAINSALANGKCNVPNRPDKPYAKRHKDFTLIATANTYGRGADRVYAGRNQLDEATLDRFRIGMVECYYDPTVEKALCPDDELRHKLQKIRQKIEQNGLRRLMSTRFIEDAYEMQMKRDWDLKKILDGFFEGWTREEINKVKTTT